MTTAIHSQSVPPRANVMRNVGSKTLNLVVISKPTGTLASDLPVIDLDSLNPDHRTVPLPRPGPPPEPLPRPDCPWPTTISSPADNRFGTSDCRVGFECLHSNP